MTAMTAAEARLVSTGARYITSQIAMSAAEISGVDVPGTFQTDARDAWYTARDLARPDHELAGITHTTLDRTWSNTYCSTCGQRTDFDQ